jgi:hypothetical protein
MLRHPKKAKGSSEIDETKPPTLTVKIPQWSGVWKPEIYDEDGIYMTQVGARGYKDYWSYLREDGNVIANKRRLAYMKRHHKELVKTGSRGWLVGKILWNT